MSWYRQMHLFIKVTLKINVREISNAMLRVIYKLSAEVIKHKKKRFHESYTTFSEDKAPKM